MMMSRNKVANSRRPCGLCQSRSYRLMYKKKGYHIGRCKRCGLVQVLDEIDDRTLPELYGRSYYEGENEFVYADYLAKSEQKSRDYEWRLATICRRNNISESGTCLEIGCAFGLFLDVARRHG